MLSLVSRSVHPQGVKIAVAFTVCPIFKYLVENKRFVTWVLKLLTEWNVRRFIWHGIHFCFSAALYYSCLELNALLALLTYEVRNKDFWFNHIICLLGRYSDNLYSLYVTLQHSQLYFWIRSPDNTLLIKDLLVNYLSKGCDQNGDRVSEKHESCHFCIRWIKSCFSGL